MPASHALARLLRARKPTPGPRPRLRQPKKPEVAAKVSHLDLHRSRQGRPDYLPGVKKATSGVRGGLLQPREPRSGLRGGRFGAARWGLARGVGGRSRTASRSTSPVARQTSRGVVATSREQGRVEIVARVVPRSALKTRDQTPHRSHNSALPRHKHCAVELIPKSNKG